MEENGLWERILIGTRAGGSHFPSQKDPGEFVKLRARITVLQTCKGRPAGWQPWCCSEWTEQKQHLKCNCFHPVQLSLCLLGWTNLRKLEKSKSPTHWRLPETLHSLSGNGLVSPPTKNYEHREFLIKASFLSLEKTYSRPCFHFQHRNRF